MTSLGVGGKQFLSNALGAAGGTSVPGWLGPRSLATIREPGPGLISCSDEQVTLLLDCGQSGTEWAVTNSGKDRDHLPRRPRPAGARSRGRAGGR